MSAPKVRFMTKIYHPNIDKLGRICLDILKGMCFESLSIYNVHVYNVYALIFSAEVVSWWTVYSLCNHSYVRDPTDILTEFRRTLLECFISCEAQQGGTRDWSIFIVCARHGRISSILSWAQHSSSGPHMTESSGITWSPMYYNSHIKNWENQCRVPFDAGCAPTMPRLSLTTHWSIVGTVP